MAGARGEGPRIAIAIVVNRDMLVVFRVSAAICRSADNTTALNGRLSFLGSMAVARVPSIRNNKTVYNRVSSGPANDPP